MRKKGLFFSLRALPDFQSKKKKNLIAGLTNPKIELVHD